MQDKDFFGETLSPGDLILYPQSYSSSSASLKVAVFNKPNPKSKSIIVLGRIRWGQRKGEVDTQARAVGTDLVKISIDKLTDEQRKLYRELIKIKGFSFNLSV